LGRDRRGVHPRSRRAVLAVGRSARRVDEARPDRGRPQPAGRHGPCRPGGRRRGAVEPSRRGMSITATRPPLFTAADRRRVGVPLAVGTALVVVSWFFAAGRADAGDQLIFVSLSLVGALLGMAATAGLLLRGRRAVGARTALLLGTAPAAPADAPPAADLVAGPDAKWYHRSDCLLV